MPQFPHLLDGDEITCTRDVLGLSPHGVYSTQHSEPAQDVSTHVLRVSSVFGT